MADGIEHHDTAASRGVIHHEIGEPESNETKMSLAPIRKLV